MSAIIEVSELEFTIPVDGLELGACIAVPPGSRGVVIVPLRSSEGRDGDAGRERAEELHRHGLASVLLDLLTVDEQWLDDQHPRRFVGDALLAARLVAAVDRFVADLPGVRLPIVVLAAGAALPIVQRAALSVPTIVSLVGDSSEVRGEADTHGEWGLGDDVGVSAAA